MSNEESEDDSEIEKDKSIVAFITHVRSNKIILDDMFSDEHLSYEDFVEAYRFLYLK